MTQRATTFSALTLLMLCLASLFALPGWAAPSRRNLPSVLLRDGRAQPGDLGLPHVGYAWYDCGDFKGAYSPEAKSFCLVAGVIRKHPKIERSDTFRPDLRIPKQWRAELSDYESCSDQYQRGHQFAARWCSTTLNERLSCLLPNVTPQNPLLNQGLWARIEARGAELAESGDVVHVYVISLAARTEGSAVCRQTVGPNQVAVPTEYLIVYAPLRKHFRWPEVVEAYRVKNEPPPEVAQRDDFRVTVDEVEAESKFDVLSELPNDLEDRLEAAQ